MDMIYPDEEISVLEEAPLNDKEIEENFPLMDFGAKIDEMLGVDISQEKGLSDEPLLETGEEIINVPLIDTEAKIRQMLDF